MAQGKFKRATFDHQPQLCERCQNYAGGCPWTRVGEDGRVCFTPVPGWTAEKVVYGGTKDSFTYQISACPLYVADPPRKRDETKRRGHGG